mmetsp:Transcript_62527/g.183304  ORF Transcript_62527/g.183304 Transcript_62527/m.183304 type:complete len:202 (+) Transcript_62527:159-764(+)
MPLALAHRARGGQRREARPFGPEALPAEARRGPPRGLPRRRACELRCHRVGGLQRGRDGRRRRHFGGRPREGLRIEAPPDVRRPLRTRGRLHELRRREQGSAVGRLPAALLPGLSQGAGRVRRGLRPRDGRRDLPRHRRELRGVEADAHALRPAPGARRPEQEPRAVRGVEPPLLRVPGLQPGLVCSAPARRDSSLRAAEL